MYSIFADLERGIVRAHFTGFLDTNEVADFSREEQEAARAVTARHGCFDLMISSPDGMPQAQKVMLAFQQLIELSHLKARLIAIVAESTLLRMQIRRLLTSDHVRAFATRAEAETWLQSKAAEALASEVH